MPDEILPCPRCGKMPEQFGVVNAYRCPEGSPCSKNQGWMSLEDWNRRPAQSRVEWWKRLEKAAKDWNKMTRGEDKKIKDLQDVLAAEPKERPNG